MTEEKLVSNVLEVKIKTGTQKLEANVHQKIKEARGQMEASISNRRIKLMTLG